MFHFLISGKEKGYLKVYNLKVVKVLIGYYFHLFILLLIIILLQYEIYFYDAAMLYTHYYNILFLRLQKLNFLFPFFCKREYIIA